MEKGMVRKIDELGRVVLPVEWRRALSLEEGTLLEMMFINGEISVKKYEPSCSFCNKDYNLIMYNGKRICRECADKIAKISAI